MEKHCSNASQRVEYVSPVPSQGGGGRIARKTNNLSSKSSQQVGNASPTPAQGGETANAKGNEAYQKIKLYIKKANDYFFLINKFFIFASN